MTWEYILKSKISKESGEYSKKFIELALARLKEEYKDWNTLSLTVDNWIYLLVEKVGGPPISCKIMGVNKFKITKTEEFMEAVKPTYRSLNWFYEVAESTSGIDIRRDGVFVEGQRGNEYQIMTESLKTSGCYEVVTKEGYSICIEIAEEKPAGDNLLGLALGLLNDEQSAEEIEGILDYLSDYANVDCKVCGSYNEIEISEEEFTCTNCKATTSLTEIQFAPGFEADYTVEVEEGPDGSFDPEYSHHTGDIFFVGNKLFRIDNRGEYDLTVRNDPEAILEYTGEGEIYIYNNEFYNEEGYSMNLDDVRNNFSKDKDFIYFVLDYYSIDGLYDYLDYENLGGDLWTDNQGEYLDSDGNFTDDIEEIYNLSEMSEEEFIMNAIEEWDLDESDVLVLFDYVGVGEYWTKDGKNYKLVDGEMVEQDEGGITKNLSSKAVLPINMKWTDYLRKTSNTKAEDWESALKSFISDGKKLGIPLSVMELLKLAKEATTSQSEGFETLHRPTFSEEEEEDV